MTVGIHNFFPSQWTPACVVSRQGGVVASWFIIVRSSPDQAVRVRALAGDIVLCSWARHFTLTVPLSTQVYKWVPANLRTFALIVFAQVFCASHVSVARASSLGPREAFPSPEAALLLVSTKKSRPLRFTIFHS